MEGTPCCVEPRAVCATEPTNMLKGTHGCTNKSACDRVSQCVWPSIPLPQQRPCELFSRSLATLIMSGPPQSINQPSVAPTQPTNGSPGEKEECVQCTEAELFTALHSLWVNASKTAPPVISAYSSTTSVRMRSKNICMCVHLNMLPGNDHVTETCNFLLQHRFQLVFIPFI